MEITAAKSRLGHAEAGAGALGLFQVVQRLEHLQAAPLTHLRSINPHLVALLASGPKKSSPMLLVREAGPGSGVGQDWHMGVSSFAFQVRGL